MKAVRIPQMKKMEMATTESLLLDQRRRSQTTNGFMHDSFPLFILTIDGKEKVFSKLFLMRLWDSFFISTVEDKALVYVARVVAYEENRVIVSRG